MAAEAAQSRGSRASSVPILLAGASVLAGCAAAIVSHVSRGRQRRRGLPSLVPLMECLPSTGKAKRIERFGEYVGVRQLGVPPHEAPASLMAQAADDYVRGDKSRADKSRDNLMALAVSACAESVGAQDREERAKKLTQKLIQELDACMFAYFGFHWQHGGLVLKQVLTQILQGKDQRPQLKEVVMAVMSKQRQQRALTELRAQQRINLLLEEMRVLGRSKGGGAQGGSGSVPSSLSHSSSSDSSSSSSSSSLPSSPSTSDLLIPLAVRKRSPVLLFIGGGMGAGKSTVVREILKRCFWSKVACDAVVVEADSFKEKDVIYQALSSDALADMAQVAQLVHEESTRAASSTLVTALNEGRDIIFDGTMAWAPFVRQTIAMARDVHRRRYRMGPGYQEQEDGSVEEQYWEPAEAREGEESGEEEEEGAGVERRPYRIEFVGVVCDVHLAVARGMRRAILTKRGVPVDGQLRSHALFAHALEGYCELVDDASIYSTNEVGQPPKLIAVKEKLSDLLIDPRLFPLIQQIKRTNCAAKDCLELYREPSKLWLPFLSERPLLGPGSTWKKIVMDPERTSRQKDLKNAFMNIQVCLWPRAHGSTTSSTSFSTLAQQ